MAINPNTAYPDNTAAPNANYPQGSARNVTTPGDNTGTPFDEAWVNDVWGLLQRTIRLAIMTPSGTPDNAVVSQYGQALTNMLGPIETTHIATGSNDAYTLTASLHREPWADLNTAQYGNVITFWPLNNSGNTGAFTVDVDSLGPQPLVDRFGDPLKKGAIRYGKRVSAWWDNNNSRFVLSDPGADIEYQETLALKHQNAIINGNQRIWQRGIGPFANSAGAQYTADRWLTDVNNGTISTTRQTFADDQSDVPGGPQFYASHDMTALINSATSYARISTRIENVRRFKGQRVAYSLWLKSSALRDITIEFRQHFGTGGSAAVTAIGADKQIVNVAWQRITGTLIIPDFPASTTLGTTEKDDYLEMIIWLGAGSNYDVRTDTLGHQNAFTLDLAQVALVPGEYAPRFDATAEEDTYRKCCRYYYNSQYAPPGRINLAARPVLLAASANDLYGNFTLPQHLRRDNPTVTFGDADALAPASGTVVLSSGTAIVRRNSFHGITGTAGLTANTHYELTSIQLDAEL